MCPGKVAKQQDRAGKARAGQGRAGQGRAEQDKTGQGKAEWRRGGRAAGQANGGGDKLPWAIPAWPGPPNKHCAAGGQWAGVYYAVGRFAMA